MSVSCGRCGGGGGGGIRGRRSSLSRQIVYGCVVVRQGREVEVVGSKMAEDLLDIVVGSNFEVGGLARESSVEGALDLQEADCRLAVEVEVEVEHCTVADHSCSTVAGFVGFVVVIVDMREDCPRDRESWAAVVAENGLDGRTLVLGGEERDMAAKEELLLDCSNLVLPLCK